MKILKSLINKSVCQKHKLLPASQCLQFYFISFYYICMCLEQTTFCVPKSLHHHPSDAVPHPVCPFPHPTLFNGANFSLACVLHFLRLPYTLHVCRCICVCLHTLTHYCCCFRMHTKNLTKQNIFGCCIFIFLFFFLFAKLYANFSVLSLTWRLILDSFVLHFGIAYVIAAAILKQKQQRERLFHS